MGRRGLIGLILVAALLLAPAARADSATAVYFSPHGGCTAAVVHEIAAAKHSIRVQAYSFTSAAIAKALVDASKRGVNVQVILDKSNRSAQYSSATFLEHASIAVLIDDRHAIAHNKVIIIDGAVVVTGSFNFTTQAETSNAENLLVLHNAVLAEAYAANWERHRAHSVQP